MKFALEYGEGMFGAKEAEETQQGEQCIMRLLSFGIINADRVGVGYFADVSKKLSA
jgi:hypothetical protein